ncbi:MAG: FAD-binding oxidoreductase [Actinomycetota bacterium]|nr:FAD-binding oxidoreductase [Actinomycetota bacterium]
MIDYLGELPESAGLVVVGGGVVGAATAFYAAQAGLDPLVLERRAALCTLTTPASTGAFRLQFDNREELELVRESVALFLNFKDVTGQGDYDLAVRQQGYLWLTTDERRAGRQRTLVARQRGWGQDDVELVNGDEVRSRWPYVKDGVVQARWRAGDGFLDPKALTLGLVAGSRAPVCTGCGVTGFRTSNGRLTGVETNRGTVACESAVIAAGPFSGVVGALAGLRLPLTTVARHKVVMPDVPEVPPGAPMTIDDDTGAHWRPALRGAYLLHTDPATPPSPPADDVTPDHRVAQALLDPASPVLVARVSDFWEGVWARGSAHWFMQSGHYTMTPDHRPLLGPSDLPGLHLNTGYSGHGIMGSPAGSRRFIDVLTGRTPPEDNAFRADRAFSPRDLDIL